MSESFSKVEFMQTLPRSNGWESMTQRENVNPTGLTIEQIELGQYGPAYMDMLIKRKRENFHMKEHRHDVSKSDPIAVFVCERYIEEITAKPMKFYELEQEEEPEEIMMDLPMAIEQLNITEIFRAIYKPWARDGYALSWIYPSATGAPAYSIWGFPESPPDYWKRYNLKGTPYHNVIYDYFVSYIPTPQGIEYMANYNIHAEEMHLSPQTPGFFHFARKDWNHGIGVSRLQPIWASMTKLRKMAHADYRRALVFNILEYPEDWDPKMVDSIIEAGRRVDEVEGLALPKRVNNISNEVEDWPILRERTWDERGGSPRSDPSAGGSLLRHSEYARVLIALGYTETKLVGSQPGEVTGSKLDLTRDDQVDIREFNLFKPVIKTVLAYLAQMGFLANCEGETLQRIMTQDYDIKCHVEYEVLMNQQAAAEMADQQANMDGQQSSTMNNKFAQAIILDALRNNANTPGMIPVQSSWVQQMGVLDNKLWFKFKNWPYYAGYQFDSNDEAYQKYLGAAEGSTTKWGDSGSTGAWIWENIWAPGTEPFSRGPRPTMPGINEDVEGIRYSRDPFSYMGGPTGQDFGLGDWETKSQYLIEGEKGLVGTQRTGRPMIRPSTMPAMAATPSMTAQAPMSTSSYQAPVQPNTTKSYPITGGEVKKTKHRSRGKSKTRIGRDWATTSYVAPTTDYNYTNSISYKRANEIMEATTGKGMSPNTWDKIKKFLSVVQDENKRRYNSVIDSGNPMNFEIPLRYKANNAEGFTEEFACKREWKKIKPHKGELFLYENLGHGGKKFNVGAYRYYWDEENDMPKIDRKIDDDKIRTLLKELGVKSSVIEDRLNQGLPPPMSTEYYCSVIQHEGKNYQVRFHDGRGNPYLRGIAIVNEANCGEPFCNFKKKESDN